jgi:molybdate transport system ATP-binding protein
MSNAKPFISLKDVTLHLGDRELFEGLCWEMQNDQHWAVIGPNGSGKSTLMKALCGSLPVVKGQVVYHFMAANGHHAARDHITHVTFENQGAVPSEDAFYQARWNAGIGQETPSVAEYLSEQSVQRINPFQVVESRADPEFQARRQDAIERMELRKLLDRKLVALSNGERRKVAIARALLTSPRLLILDSPFVGLDERFRTKLRENLENLMQGEMRVLVVGTSRDEIPDSTSHILWVQEGQVIAQGRREAVLTGAAAHVARGAPILAIMPVAAASQAGAAPSSKVLVHMENVTVSYNGTAVLRQVDWIVRENERWALLGPNGAGKTTLLSLILADNPQAYANKITLFGRRRGSGESIWEIKRNIGWVAPELLQYYPRNATCLDVACSGWFDSVGLYRECSPHERQVALSWLQQFGLTERAGTELGQVSEGEQRLALLARALVKSPTLLVLDEPCQGLDVGNRDRVVQAIDGVGRQPETSMIYVTHHADELPQSITHVLKLSEGQVVEQGTKRN